MKTNGLNPTGTPVVSYVYLLWGWTSTTVYPFSVSYFIICRMLIYSGLYPAKFFIGRASLIFLLCSPDSLADKWTEKWKEGAFGCFFFPEGVTGFSVNCGFHVLFSNDLMVWCGVDNYFPLPQPKAFAKASLSLILWFISPNSKQQRQHRDKRRL